MYVFMYGEVASNWPWRRSATERPPPIGGGQRTGGWAKAGVGGSGNAEADRASEAQSCGRFLRKLVRRIRNVFFREYVLQQSSVLGPPRLALPPPPGPDARRRRSEFSPIARTMRIVYNLISIHIHDGYKYDRWYVK